MSAKNEKKTGAGMRSGISEVVGLDVATTGVKAVKLSASRDGLSLVACAEFPAVPLNGARPEGVQSRVILPKEFRACNVGMALTSKKSIIRLLKLPGVGRSAQVENNIRNQAGVDRSFRLGYSVLPGARGKTDANVLAVGVPDAEARSALELIEDQQVGMVALEVSALAAASAFARTPAVTEAKGAVALIEAGAQVSCLAIFHNGLPVLIRKFEFGSLETQRRVQRQFGVDEETAQSIITDSSVDIGQAVQEAVGPFVRQLAISREFVERKAGVPITAWYLSGGITMAGYWSKRIRETVGKDVRTWNPLEGVEVAPGAWPDALRGQECRFAAAVGSAAGVLQE